MPWFIYCVLHVTPVAKNNGELKESRFIIFNKFKFIHGSKGTYIFSL